MDKAQIHQAYTILDQAHQEHRPSRAAILVSGGPDSVPTAHIAAQWADRIGLDWECLHLDTGIAVAETHAFVRELCAESGWPLAWYKATENTNKAGRPDPQHYDQLVMESGFPGPPMHGKMYDRLKGRSIARYVRDHKQHRGDRILFVTGVRKQESQRRMGLNSPVRRMGATVWVNPLFYWSNPQRDAYNSWAGLRLNPVKQCLGISGDCLCGAFGHPSELTLLKRFYPQEYERIQVLRARVAAVGLWSSWGVAPPAWYTAQGASQQRTFMPLCVGCENRHQTVHIGDFRSDYTTVDRLIGRLHQDDYHHPISQAAAHLFAAHPEHHWKYLGQYQSGSTLWRAQDTPDSAPTTALITADGSVDISTDDGHAPGTLSMSEAIDIAKQWCVQEAGGGLLIALPDGRGWVDLWNINDPPTRAHLMEIGQRIQDEDATIAATLLKSWRARRFAAPTTENRREAMQIYQTLRQEMRHTHEKRQKNR